MQYKAIFNKMPSLITLKVNTHDCTHARMTILSSMDCGNWTQDSIDYKPSGQPREENTGKCAYNADINKTRDYLTHHINFGYDNTDSL
jgi:hypothetical protein